MGNRSLRQSDWRQCAINQSGSLMIPIIFCMATFGIIAMSFVPLRAHLFSVAVKTAQATNLEVIRQSLISTALDDKAWELTYSRNSGMNCLTTKTAQCASGSAPITNQPFRLYRSDGSPFYDATDAKAGFTAQGRPCWKFDPIKARDGCFFRFELSWSANCAPPNCDNPSVIVQAPLRVAQNAGVMPIITGLSMPPVLRMPR